MRWPQNRKLIINRDVSAAIAKPLLAAGLSHNTNKMKAKVIIENEETTIILTPENEFEIDVIEKVHCKKEKHSIRTDFDAQYNYGTYSKHKIELSIKEQRPLVSGRSEQLKGDEHKSAEWRSKNLGYGSKGEMVYIK